MLDAIKSAAGAILQPVVGLVDNLHTSDEEKLTLRAQIEQIKADLVGKLIETEARLLESQHKLQTAELQQDDLVTKRWRPFVGYGLGAAVIFNLIAPQIAAMVKPGLVIPPADPSLIAIAASLLGVGTVSRSMEKRGRNAAAGAAALAAGQFFGPRKP